MKKHLFITLTFLSTASLLQAKGFDPLTADDTAFTRKIAKIDNKTSRPEYRQNDASENLIRLARDRIECLVHLRHLKSPLKIHQHMGAPLESFSEAFMRYQDATKAHKQEKKVITSKLLAKRMCFLTDEGDEGTKLSEHCKVSGNGIKVATPKGYWEPLQITTTTEDGRLSFEIPQVLVGKKLIFRAEVLSSKPIQATFPSDDSLPSTLYPRPAAEGGLGLGCTDIRLAIGFTVSSRQSPAVFSLVLPKDNVLYLHNLEMKPYEEEAYREEQTYRKAHENLVNALRVSAPTSDRDWDSATIFL